MTPRITLRAQVFLWPGQQAAWHFARIPETVSARIKKKYGAQARGWGSLPVRATIGKTTWESSLFPDKQSGTYLLPLKLAVRRAEDITQGDTVALSLVIRVAR